MTTKKSALDFLRKILKELFATQYEGITYKKFIRAQGYADGYMRALLELGVVDKKELLKLVMDERHKSASVDNIAQLAS